MGSALLTQLNVVIREHVLPPLARSSLAWPDPTLKIGKGSGEPRIIDLCHWNVVVTQSVTQLPAQTASLFSAHKITNTSPPLTRPLTDKPSRSHPNFLVASFASEAALFSATLAVRLFSLSRTARVNGNDVTKNDVRITFSYLIAAAILLVTQVYDTRFT